MRFLHLADLHIGKRVNEFLMLEDQEFALKQIIDICDEKNVDAVLMAGDIYDRSIPVAEAVGVFDNFLTELYKRELDIFIISGNHDSPQRLEFAKGIMEKESVYISGVFKGNMQKVVKKDEYGNVNIYMLAFIRAEDVKKEDESVFKDYTEAVEYVIKKAEINKDERNIIISHQFVTPLSGEVERSDSEIGPVGGIDNVLASVYDDFDYAALGHLHGAQKVGGDNIRYAGSPIKYSFSEIRQKKSVTFCELKNKGELTIELIELKPLRDMRQIRGKLKEVLKEPGNREDYIRAILTDEELIYDAIGSLRAVYPNVMKIEFENRRTAEGEILDFSFSEPKGKEPRLLFEEFFRLQNNIEMSEGQKQTVSRIFKEIEGEKDETC